MIIKIVWTQLFIIGFSLWVVFIFGAKKDREGGLPDLEQNVYNFFETFGSFTFFTLLITVPLLIFFN